MEMQDTIELSNGHQIEISDVAPLVTAVSERDLLDVATTTQLVEALRASLARRQHKPAQTLAELLSQVTDDNIHAEVDMGPPVGKEVW
jgi:hypothetical protein